MQYEITVDIGSSLKADSEGISYLDLCVLPNIRLNYACTKDIYTVTFEWLWFSIYVNFENILYKD